MRRVGFMDGFGLMNLFDLNFPEFMIFLFLFMKGLESVFSLFV